MLRLFLGNQFIANLLLPLFVVFYVLLNFGTNHLEIPALIDFGFWGKFHPIERYLSSILSGSLILINAFTLNHLFNSNEFHDKNNFSIALFYVVFMSFFHSFYQLDGILVSHTFLILGMFHFLKIESNKDARRNAFNGSLCIGFSATFHPPLLIFWFINWLLITRIRPFIWREISLSMAGFLLPILYSLVFLQFTNQLYTWKINQAYTFYSQSRIVNQIALILLSMVALLSLMILTSKTLKSALKFKKMTAILKIILVLSTLIGIYLFTVANTIEGFSTSILILSFFFPFVFFNKSSFLIGNILFYSIFVFSTVKFFINS